MAFDQVSESLQAGIYFIFGKKGAGKTTYLTKLAYKYNKKGIPVYCNTEIPGTFLFDAAKDIGFVKFPENSVIMIDEVSLIWDNRNFKSFRPEVGKFFRLQRHHKNIVYLFSQTFDVDLKIRNQCDKMYLLQNYFGWLSYAKEIKRKLTVVHPSENTEARIADDLEIPPFWLAIFGSRELIFIPRWAKYFDSHLIEEPLPVKDFEYQPYKKISPVRAEFLKQKILTNVLTKVLKHDRMKPSNKGGSEDGTEKDGFYET